MSIKLITYTAFGYPTIEESIKRAEEYVRGGSDCLEIDFPTKNPFLDSEYIGDKMKTAYSNCSNYDTYFEGISELKSRLPNIDILILAYEHTVKEIGIEKFVYKCKELHITDMIIVGLENNVVKDQLISSGMKISCYVQFQMKEDEIEMAKNSNGFIYMQAKVEGRVNPKYDTLGKCIAKLREEGIQQTIFCGVGISTSDDIKMVKAAGADGVFVGSALMKQPTYDDAKKFLQELKKCT